MRSILCLFMISMCLGCTKSDDLEDITEVEMDSTVVCINSLEQLETLNNGLDTFNITRIVLDDDSEIMADGQNLSVVYSIKPTSGGNSLFDSSLNIKVNEEDIIKTYTATVWSKGCRNGHDAQGSYTNLISGTTVYKVNTYFNWVARPYGAGGPRIKYLVLD